MNEQAEFARLREAVIERFSDFASVRFDQHTMGFDSVALEAKGTIFKFPRHAVAEENLRMEVRLLDVVRPAVKMNVPSLALVEGTPVFSRHEKIPGEHVETADYETLPETARSRLAGELAQFYAELHAIDAMRAKAVGVAEIGDWGAPEVILREALLLLPAELYEYAERTVSDYAALLPDPLGKTFGYFDGHGWNMAFDHERLRLNGMYDFGDSGFGDLQREFMYSDFISPDLTDRIIAEYENLTARAIDRERVTLLTAYLRLAELASFAGQPERVEWVVGLVKDWKAYQQTRK